MRKFVLLFFIIIFASSIIPVSSEGTELSTPEFTLRYVDHSYDVPPTNRVDPYTGKNVTTQAGYHIQNNSIEVIIKNQQFKTYRNENNSLVELHYYIAASWAMLVLRAK